MRYRSFVELFAHRRRMKRQEYFENLSSIHLSDGCMTRSLERYRMSRDIDWDCRSPRPGDRSLGQFIMFRLSSHLAREIEWRFSFGDISGTGNNSAAVSLSFSLLPFYRHCPASNYCTRGGGSPLPFFIPAFLSFAPLSAAGCVFFSTRYAIRLLHSSWICNYTAHVIYTVDDASVANTEKRVLIRHRDDSGPREIN